MSAFLLTADLFVVFFLTLYLLNKYGNWRRQRLIVTVATFLGWYFSFIILFVLPLDVSITFYNRCESERTHTNSTIPCEKPQGYIADNVLLSLWRIVYWTAQCLTWIILPLLQSYSQAGEFTNGERFKAALKNNLIWYGVDAAIFILILVYAIFKGVVINMESLKVILVSASNTWGLFMLVLLLGYGLVELPRSLWYKGSRNYRLNKTYFNIDKLSTGKCDTEDNLKQQYRESRRILNALGNDPPRRELAQIILDKFPQDVVDELFPARSATDFSGAADADLFNTDKYLISQHKIVISCIQAHHRTSAQWRALVEKAMFLEDVAQAETSGQLNSTSTMLPQGIFTFWHVRCQKAVCKILACFLSVMTVFILISECTFFVIHPTLSPAALLMEYAAERFHYKYTQIVAMGVIWYLCASAYFTLFRLKIYKYYHLDSHQHTDENSLLFSAILLCRLTPPICLNFLGMVHLDSHITMIKDYAVETQFTKLMGHLDVIPILAKGINIYLPMCILILCAVNYYKLGSRFLHLIGIDQFIADDEFTQDMVNSGRALVQVERNVITRRANRDRRGEHFASNLRARERVPILEAEEGARLDSYDNSSSLIEHPSLPAEQISRREHPSPTNLFDDM